MRFEDCDECLTTHNMSYVSLGNEQCYPCDDQGKTANADKSMCIACQAGQQPTANRTGCEDCTGNEYSTFGIGQALLSRFMPACPQHLPCAD